MKAAWALQSLRRTRVRLKRTVESSGWPVAFAPLVITALFWPTGQVLAAGPPCGPVSNTPLVRAAADDERTADLAEPFRFQRWRGDRARLLLEARQRATVALDTIGADRCYTELVPRIAGRTAFLAPFEFLVVQYYERDWEQRDALLRLYAEHPQQAVRQLSKIWPSPRAEMLVRMHAVYDADGDQVYVNLGVVSPDDALNVLVHEFWHALATVRVTAQLDGSVSRTSGFWTEMRSAGGRFWRPLEEEIEGGVPTYLMNEAVAIEMEVAATAHEHPHMRADLARAVYTLHELFEVAGRSQVLQLYLESRTSELKVIARQAAMIRRNRTLMGAQ